MKRIVNYFVLLSICICCLLLVGKNDRVVFAESERKKVDITSCLLKSEFIGNLKTDIDFSPNISKYLNPNPKSKEIKAKYYIIKEDVEKTSKNYIYLGKGNILKEEKVVDNHKKVVENMGKIPNYSKWITSEEEIVWYAIQEEKDGWHVEGYITTKTKTYSSVEDMSKADIKEGEYVKTLGYYSENDGGAGTYVIENSNELKENGGTCIQLQNGLFANLVMEHGSVSVKQFGARSDVDFDNAEVFNRVFSSGVRNLEFPNGEYKVKSQFEIKANNMNIQGNKSVIYIDNSYKEYQGYGECLLIISKSKNVVIDGLKIEFRQTKQTACEKQFEIAFSDQITLQNCEFKIPETVSLDLIDKKMASFCNGSLWTGWSNITIKNCKFIQLSDTNTGGCFGINDYYGKGGTNLVFTDNYCEYAGHDECIAIFTNQGGTIKNVNIVNNEIISLPSSGSYASTMCFSIGYNDSNIEDVTISNNTIKGYSDFAFMTIDKAKNVTIKENDITYLKDTKSCYPVVFRTSVANYDKNIIIEGNTINIDQEVQETSPGMGGICEGKMKFYNNTVNYKVYGYTLFLKDVDVQNNEIYMYKGGNELGAEMTNFINNKVVLDGKTQYLFKFRNKALKEDVRIIGNEIYYNYWGGANNEIALLISDVLLNGYSFTFSGNKIYTQDTKNKYLYSISIKDQLSQTIEISNNETGAFTKTEVLKCDLMQHNMLFMNNN